MKTVFISIPTKDKLRSEIVTERAKILARVNEILGEPVLLIENDVSSHELYSQKPLVCLGESIKRLSDANCAVFGEGWQNSRRCSLEHICAELYGIDILEI